VAHQLAKEGDIFGVAISKWRRGMKGVVRK